MPDKITVAEAATLLGIGPMGVRDLIYRGRIKAEKVMRDWVVDAQSVEEFKREREEKKEKK